MDLLPEKGYKRILILVFYFCLLGLLVFVFLKYLLSILLPFIIAWGVGLVIRPLAEKLSSRTKISQKIVSVILVVIILALLGTVLFYLLDKLIYEFRGIVGYLNNNSDAWIGSMLKTVNRVLGKLPFFRTFGSEEEMLSAMLGMAKGMIADVTAKIPAMLTGIITVIPNLLFVSLVLIMASYYFCADYETVNRFFTGLIPQKGRSTFSMVRVRLKDMGIRVLKGYILTVGITFLQLYTGFLVLNTEYAFTIALVTALVDILPVIGVGTVLIPWAAVKIVAGAYYQGFGLLIIFAVVSVVREIIEPKIIGKSIGLHPLMTLFSMYTGLKICGFVGMISFPVMVIAVKTLFFEKEINKSIKKT